MSKQDSKILELEKKLERLQTYISFLEKHIQVDNQGIALSVEGSIISITGNEIIIRSEGALNILSDESTMITSGASLDIQSQGDMDLRGSVIHIN